MIKLHNCFSGFLWGNDFIKRGDYHSLLINGLPTLAPIITNKGVKYWELVDDWFVSLSANETALLIIPKGSKTNFASIPWFLRWLISPLDPVIAIPSIVHDYLVGEFAEDINNSVNKYTPYESIKVNVLREGYEWIDAALLFRKMALAFSGREAYVKANICFVCILVYGLIKNISKGLK